MLYADTASMINLGGNFIRHAKLGGLDPVVTQTDRSNESPLFPHGPFETHQAHKQDQ